MPDNAPAQNASTAPATSSSTPPGTTPTSATPPAAPQPTAASEPFKFGEAAPTWARGKTAEEVLGIATQLVDSFQRYGNAPAAQAAQTQYNAAQSAAPAAPVVADDDYITGAQLKALLADANTRHVQPAITQSTEMAASTNLAFTRQTHADVFARYGPEVTAKLAGVPKHLWTLDNLETVVKLVKADHLDEIARERAQQLVGSMEPTIRSTGAGGSVPVPSKEHSLESDAIPAEWKQRAMRAGVTESVVREFCAANDMEPATFYKQFEHLEKYAGNKNPIVGEIGRREETNG